MEKKQKKDEGEGTSSVFKVGAISLAFLVIGYQAAVFVNHAARSRIVANRDMPDTVYVVDEALAARLLTPDSGNIVRRNAARSSGAKALYASAPPAKEGESRPKAAKHARRQVESFRFNPNTVSLDELVRLGFSEKQAQSIVNYREKGGRFRRKSDFAKSYVVADSVFKRLEPYIVIPKLDINAADSAAFDELPGIGGYFAGKMVEYRRRLGGYSCTQQLMDIYHFDEEKYSRLADLIICTPAPAFPLWSAPADSLRLHPHIRSWQTARAIVLYREHNPREAWTVEGLLKAGILTEEQAAKLSLCRLE